METEQYNAQENEKVEHSNVHLLQGDCLKEMRKLLRQAIEEQKEEEKLKEKLKLPFNYTKQIYQDWIDKEKRR